LEVRDFVSPAKLGFEREVWVRSVSERPLWEFFSRLDVSVVEPAFPQNVDRMILPFGIGVTNRYFS